MGFDGSWGRLFLPTRIIFTESASRIDTLGYFWAFFFSFRFSAFDFILFLGSICSFSVARNSSVLFERVSVNAVDVMQAQDRVLPYSPLLCVPLLRSP